MSALNTSLRLPVCLGFNDLINAVIAIVAIISACRTDAGGCKLERRKQIRYDVATSASDKQQVHEVVFDLATPFCFC